MPVQACSQLHTLVAIVTRWQREASVVPGINSNPDNTTLNRGAICSEEPPEKHPSSHLSGGLRGTLCPRACVNVSGWERGSGKRRLIKIWTQRRKEGRVCVCVCVAWEHGHYVDFLFSFRMLEEYFLFCCGADGLLPPMLPGFMSRQGWSEGQKSGNQVNYGWRLADKSEREKKFFSSSSF